MPFTTYAIDLTVNSYEELKSGLEQGGDVTISLNQDLTGAGLISVNSGNVTLDGQKHSIGWQNSSSDFLQVNGANSITIQNIGQITYDENGIATGGEGGITGHGGPYYNVYIGDDTGDAVFNSVVFKNNSGIQPGASTIHYHGSGSLSILGSVFMNNTLNINSSNLINLGREFTLISHSLFQENHSSYHGGALNFGSWDDIGPSLDWTTAHFIDKTNFIKNSSDQYGGAIAMLYSDQQLVLKDSSFIGNTSAAGGAILIYASQDDNGAPLTLIAEDLDVWFKDNVAQQGVNDILISDAVVNLNAKSGRFISFEGGIEGNNGDGRDVININKPDVAYYESAQAYDSRTPTIAPAGGEVRFNAPIQNVTVNLYGGTLSLLKAGDVMRTSVLNFEGLSTLNTQNGELQEILIGQIGFRSNANWSVDVNLNDALADQLSLADSGRVENYTQSTLQVSDWQVLEDDLSETQVDVNLSQDQRLNKNNLGLAESGKTAQGPVYQWDVEYLGDGNYRFSRAGTPTEPEPEDFNPEVYGDTVASAGITVIQHSITEGIFANYRDSMTFTEEKPEKDPWWVKTIGSNFNMQPKNFGTIDLEYAVAMIGHNFESLYLADNSRLDFGVYGGWVGAKHEYVGDNKIRQNGGFVGGSSFYQKESLWMGLNLNVGWVDNDFTGRDGRADSEMPWVGFGATAGYTFNLPAYQMKIQPSLSASYVMIDDDHYTTARGADVEMDKVHSWELSPGLTVSKAFSNGISASANVRYAWVDESSGKLTAKDTIGLPAIAFDDYVEYGIAMHKVTDQTTWRFAINRNDMGREGWSGNIYYGWKF